jgi:hypothetical protein
VDTVKRAACVSQLSVFVALAQRMSGARQAAGTPLL